MILQGNISSRGNDLLSGILGRTSVSFSQVLASASQANRDQINLQSTQANNFLEERRFDRTFTENQFQNDRNFDEGVRRDDRNFNEGVRRDDRNFGENVRQFNAQDANTDASRSLQRELGFARLSREDRRIGISETDQSLRSREFNIRNNDTNLDLKRADTLSTINARDTSTRLNNLNIDNATIEALTSQLRTPQDITDARESFGSLDNFKASPLGNPNSTEEDRKLAIRAVDLAESSLGRVVEGDTASMLKEAESTDDPGLSFALASEAQAIAKANGDVATEARAKAIAQVADTKFEAQIDDNRISIDGQLLPPIEKQASGRASVERFANAEQAINVAKTIKSETGITKLEITNRLGTFSRRFSSADQFRNAVLSEAFKEGKEVKISKEQAKLLFDAENFNIQSTATSAPIPALQDADAAAILEGL